MPVKAKRKSKSNKAPSTKKLHKQLAEQIKQEQQQKIEEFKQENASNSFEQMLKMMSDPYIQDRLSKPHNIPSAYLDYLQDELWELTFALDEVNKRVEKCRKWIHEINENKIKQLKEMQMPKSKH